MRYFRINSSLPDINGWSLEMPMLDDQKPVDVSKFFSGNRVDIASVKVKIDRPGVPLDWTIAPIEMSIISCRCADLIQSVTGGADIQLIPAIIDGRTGYFVLVTLAIVDCIDYTKSKMTVYPPSHYHKDLVGKPQYILDLKIDRSIVQDRHLFRVKYNSAALILSEQLMQAFESHKYSGIRVIYEV